MVDMVGYSTIDEATSKLDGCLIHDMGSMVALMDTIVSGSPHQVCEISSNQSIMTDTSLDCFGRF